MSTQSTNNIYQFEGKAMKEAIPADSLLNISIHNDSISFHG